MVLKLIGARPKARLARELSNVVPPWEQGCSWSRRPAADDPACRGEQLKGKRGDAPSRAIASHRRAGRTQPGRGHDADPQPCVGNGSRSVAGLPCSRSGTGLKPSAMHGVEHRLAQRAAALGLEGRCLVAQGRDRTRRGRRRARARAARACIHSCSSRSVVASRRPSAARRASASSAATGHVGRPRRAAGRRRPSPWRRLTGIPGCSAWNAPASAAGSRGAAPGVAATRKGTAAGRWRASP